MEMIQDDGDLMTGAMVEVEEDMMDPMCAFDPTVDPHSSMYDQEMLEPVELDDGRFTCKQCIQQNREPPPIFNNKSQFASHRYRFHGPVTTTMPCPEDDCDLYFSSVLSLKKHLQHDRNLPIEVHYKQFNNMSEFENWRTTVEHVTSSKFVLHNKQAVAKRNIMHCFRSEHKSACMPKGILRNSKMRKRGAACPAHIAFIENHSGTVEVVYQLFHLGHELDNLQLDQPGGTEDDEDLMDQNDPIPLNSIFPVPNRLPRSAAMQYIQFSLLNLPEAPYLSTRYSQLLVLLDVQSYFVFAKPIPSPRFVSAHVHKSHIVREIVEIFTQFGCPVGFSVCGSSPLLFDAIKSVEEVFDINLTHVGNVTPDLAFLRKAVIERAQEELERSDRWPEVVPFAVYSHNTEGGGNKYLSPYELMFGRCPPQSQSAETLMEDANRTQMNAVLGLKFDVGDEVLVRFFDPDLLAEGPIRNASQPQPSSDYMNGIIADVDWFSSPFYPYKVHICRSTEEPNPDCPFIWVSPFDVAPSVGDLRSRRNMERRDVAASLMCACTEMAGGEGRCILPRSDYCSHKMSRLCCEKLNRRCDYHQLYNSGAGESYRKIEDLGRRFVMKDCERKEVEEAKILCSIAESERREEEERLRVGGRELIERLDLSLPSPSPTLSSLLPPTLEKMIEGEKKEVERIGGEGQGTSRVKQGMRIAEKKMRAGVKRKVEEMKKNGGEERTTKKRDAPVTLEEQREEEEESIQVDQSSRLSTDESPGDRRKSGRVSKPNTLYKSFVVD